MNFVRRGSDKRCREKKEEEEETMRKRLFAISMGLVLYAVPISAGFLSAQLDVNGLTCPFCAFGIEKKLLDVPGVRAVEVFLDEGRIALTFEPNSEATVDDLERAVKKAGFELSGLSIETDGEVLWEGRGDFRLVAHPGMTFRLVEAIDGREGPVSEKTLRRLSGTDKSIGEWLIVEGAVAERDAHEPLLVIRKIEPTPGPAN